MKNYYRALMIVVLLAGLWMTSVITNCASTGEQKEVTISPERQKAIQDSLKKVWEKQLLLSWSLGWENYKNKMYKDALKHFWRVAELDTVEKFPLLYNYMGESYLALNKSDSAEIAYRLGVENYPEKAYYHRSLGYLLVAKKETDEAIEQYQKAIELDEEPKVEDYQVLGNLLLQANRPDEALEVYGKLVEMNPDDVEAQKVYAQLLKSSGDEDAAIDAQIAALNNDPENTRLMFSLGETFFKRGEYEKSIKYLNMSLARKPEDVVALEYVGNAQQNLGEFRKAIATYEKVLALKPDHKKVLAEMATCYQELGQFAKGRSIARQALQIDSDFGLAHIVIGDIYASAVDACITQRGDKAAKFDDKLVYQLAYESYQRATKDIQYADLGRRKMEYIKSDIPTKEDRFMHQDQTKARFDCYQWIY